MNARVFAAATLITVSIVSASTHTKPAAQARAVPTFAKDVAPILYKRCAACHRPGEIAPMSLLTYDDAKAYAAEIRDEVGAGHMPPWQANAPAGTFLGERTLPDDEKATLLAWASNGTPLGDPKDLPPAPSFPQGWAIGTPDAVLEMKQEFHVPARGAVPYQYFYIPTNFTDVKWVQAIEVRPGNRAVVHHVLAYYRAVPDIRRTPIMRPDHTRTPAPVARGEFPPQPMAGMQKRLIASFGPGTNPQIMPQGTGLRLEPGGIIELEIHYNANGAAGADLTKVGIVFSKDPNPRELLASAFLNAEFVLPAGQPNVAVDSGATFLQDATIFGLLPHTHLRGVRWLYELQLPDGSRKTILDVPHYSCNWQFYYLYATPIDVPKGAHLRATAWYDNSAANHMNPDPTKDVMWGDQTWEEMQYTGILMSPKVPATKAGG
jgi:hypothetical protein